MVGSLYHFYPNTFSILSKMAEVADTIVISEPVSNLSVTRASLDFLQNGQRVLGKDMKLSDMTLLPSLP